MTNFRFASAIALSLSLALASNSLQATLAQSPLSTKASTSAVVDFVDTSFENASPLWQRLGGDC